MAENSQRICDEETLNLIYTDSSNSLKIIQDNINQVNTKLGIILGFNTSIVKLLEDLPSLQTAVMKANHLDCYSCLILKLLSIFCVMVSVSMCIVGIWPKSENTIIYPLSLLEKGIKNQSAEKFRIAIILSNQEAILNLNKLLLFKASKFKLSLLFTGLVALFSSLNIFISTILF